MPTHPVLHTLNFKKTFFLQMDALGTTLWVIFFQDKGGEERPIAFTSKKLTPVETHSSTIEQGCLAIQWGCISFITT